MKLLLALLMITLFAVTACGRAPVKIAKVAPGTSLFETPDELDLSGQGEQDQEEENQEGQANGTQVIVVEVSAATPTPTPQAEAVVTAPTSAPLLVSTRPVYRSMHATSGARYWTAEWANIDSVARYYGHVYEGVAFNVATSPQGPCTIPLYSCLYVPTSMYYFSTNAGCGNASAKVVEALGFACYPNSGVATDQVTMYAHPNSWQFFTASAAEGNWAIQYGFSAYGAFYTPK